MDCLCPPPPYVVAPPSNVRAVGGGSLEARRFTEGREGLSDGSWALLSGEQLASPPGSLPSESRGEVGGLTPGPGPSPGPPRRHPDLGRPGSRETGAVAPAVGVRLEPNYPSYFVTKIVSLLWLGIFPAAPTSFQHIPIITGFVC